MGVNMKTYVAVGVMIEDEAVVEEWFDLIDGADDEEWRVDNTDLDSQFISDGMNGEYLFVGRILEVSPDGRYEPMELQYQENVSALEEIREEVFADLQREADTGHEFFSRLPIDDVRLHIFTHYS